MDQQTQTSKKYLGIFCLVAVLIIGVIIFVIVRDGSGGYKNVLSTVYLPKSGYQETEASGRISMYETAKLQKSSQYGSGVVFTATDDFAPRLFEQTASKPLDPATCPNVFNEQISSPTRCLSIGKIQGFAVYTIKRNAKSSASEAFLVRDKTFIACRLSDGQSQYALSVINALQLIPNNQVDSMLEESNWTATQHNANLAPQSQ